MNPLVSLDLGETRAQVITQEGGVLSRLTFRGDSVLAITPWSETVSPSLTPAPDEQTWVNNWRGGWQLCAPNTGLAPADSPLPAFHGLASQASWTILEQTETELKLSWKDDDGELELTRQWSLKTDGEVTAETVARNNSSVSKPVGVAEHLILGSDFLEPMKLGAIARLDVCSSAKIADLDYSGAPTGKPAMAVDANTESTRLSRLQPARVFAVVSPKRKSISVEVESKVATITWDGLEHALIWQEFGTSLEEPWNGEVFALGIEPTNVPHGLGANGVAGPFLLPGQSLTLKTTLRIQNKKGNPHDSTT